MYKEMIAFVELERLFDDYKGSILLEEFEIRSGYYGGLMYANITLKSRTIFPMLDEIQV